MKRKMFNKLVLIIFIFLIVDEENSIGEELPFLRGVEVKVEVSLNNKTGIYTYKYTITNSTASIGNLVGFDININKPEGGMDLSKEGLVYGKGYLKNTSEDILSRKTTLAIVMVGIQSPNGWTSGFSMNGTVGWGGGDLVQLRPGESLSGFELTSYGLPAIREFVAEPSFDVDKYYPSVDSLKSQEEIDALLAQIEKDEKKVSFKGKTIGPTAPPADFRPVEFLNYIITLKHQSTTFGWIKNAGVEQSLDAKLDNARKKLKEGNTTAAKNILNAFLNEVEAQGCTSYDACPEGKHLTPEAYSLLKYNTLYLLNHLK